MSGAERRSQPRVAIVGAGIGGLAAAAFMRRAGLNCVTVYEQAQQATEIGAGIQMAPNAMRLLQRLGLGAQLRAAGMRLETGWQLRRWQDGRVLFSQQLGDACERRFGAPYCVLHRAALMDAIDSLLPPGMVKRGRRCIGAVQTAAGVVLRFADGGHAEADVAVGADGIRSVLRSVVTEPLEPEFSGLAAYRCVVPAARAPALTRRPVFTSWLGPGRHLVHYPLTAQGDVNVVAVVPAGDWRAESWAAEASVAEMCGEFAGWHQTLTQLLAGADSTFLFALYDRAPLARWTVGRITLLGDAAHPMLPFFAQGAGQAIEDGVALAARLAAATSTSAERALVDYQTARLGRASRVQALSRRSPERNHLPDGPAQRQRDAELAGLDPLEHQAWVYEHDSEDAAEISTNAPVNGKSRVSA